MTQWSGFETVVTYGPNLIGRQSRAHAFVPKVLVTSLVAGAGRLLARFPSLCAGLQGSAAKPAATVSAGA